MLISIRSLTLFSMLAIAPSTILFAQGKVQPSTSHHSLTATGILLNISSTEIRLRVTIAAGSSSSVKVTNANVQNAPVANAQRQPLQLQEPVQKPQIQDVVFRIDKGTSLPNAAKPGDTVVIAYYEDGNTKIARVVELPAHDVQSPSRKVEVGGTASNEPPEILFNTGTQGSEDAKAIREKLKAQLNSVLATSESTHGLTVNMSDVLFDTGKYTLKPDAKISLAKITGILAAYPSLKLEINGYTDTAGSAEFNQALSQKRADSVKDFLLSQGISTASISAVGYGKNNPVADNVIASGRAQNRRVQLVISGDAIGTSTPQ